MTNGKLIYLIEKGLINLTEQELRVYSHLSDEEIENALKIKNNVVRNQAISLINKADFIGDNYDYILIKMGSLCLWWSIYEKAC